MLNLSLVPVTDPAFETASLFGNLEPENVFRVCFFLSFLKELEPIPNPPLKLVADPDLKPSFLLDFLEPKVESRVCFVP